MRHVNLGLAMPMTLVLVLFTAFFIGLSGCSQPQDAAWLGYAEADYVYVAAPAAGWVTSLSVERGAEVKRGQSLFALDADSQTAGRDEASAAIRQADEQIRAARATLTLAQKELVRQKALLHTSSTSRQMYDQALSARDTATATLQQLEALKNQHRATLAAAAYQLSQREITSQTSGRVEEIYFRPGEYAPSATPIISLLPPDHVYVRFFVPEKQLATLHMGQKVRISCDGCTPVVATVSFIANTYEYAPPVVFSVQSRDKLVFKAEARTPGGIHLHPGQPVDVRPL